MTRPHPARAGVLRGKALRVREVVVKEFRQLFRDPRMSRVMFVAPILQLMLFGYAVSTDVRNTSTFVVDQDRTSASRAVTQRLTAGGRFVAVGDSPSMERADAALLDRETDVIIVIPRDFEADLVRDRRAAVQLVLDAVSRSAEADSAWTRVDPVRAEVATG